jgi:hypothetical protein
MQDLDPKAVPATSHRDEVKKAYEVILARGQHELDLTDAKVFNFLLQHAYKRIGDQPIHKIPVRDAMNYLDHRRLSVLEQSLENLGKVKIEINYQQDCVPHAVSCHFLSYDVSRADNGVLQYAFDPILLRFLWQPKVYARINMKFLQQFKTVHGAKLYEIMCLYQNRYSRVWEVGLDELKEQLGVADTAYDRFDNFRQRILDRAIAEVNLHAAFNVTIQLVRSGRGGKCTSVKLSVVEKPAAGPTGSIDHLHSSGWRDPNTVDFIDGKTDVERGSSLVISTATLGFAQQTIDENSDVELDSLKQLVCEWRDQALGEIVRDSDENFMQWLNFKITKLQQPDLTPINDQMFMNLLRDF